MRRSLKIFLCLFLTIVTLTVTAQDDYAELTGIVRDAVTGKPVAYTTITAGGTHTTTVSNGDGHFTLRVRTRPREIIFSHLGYNTRRWRLTNETRLKIRLTPCVVTLAEIIVNPDDPWQVIRAAREKIPDNYPKTADLLRGFYRETTKRGNRYIYIAEAVVDMYKTPYSKDIRADRIAIDKARRLVSPRATDTLGAKIQGGPSLPLVLDLVKNIDELLADDELRNYYLSLAAPTYIDDRQQIVITMKPYRDVSYPLYFGRVYIDRATLAFTRIELDLDMSDRNKAVSFMLVKKPAGVRFRPLEMTLAVNYKLDDGVSRISYVSSLSRFNCDWKRRLFHSSYNVQAEMVVTDRYPDEEAHPIKMRDSFSNRHSLYDDVSFFNDPAFWGSDNIIEPTESLEHGIDKLKQRLRRR